MIAKSMNKDVVLIYTNIESLRKGGPWLRSSYAALSPSPLLLKVKALPLLLLPCLFISALHSHGAAAYSSICSQVSTIMDVTTSGSVWS